jgi:hypothetical protein
VLGLPDLALNHNRNQYSTSFFNHNKNKNRIDRGATRGKIKYEEVCIVLVLLEVAFKHNHNPYPNSFFNHYESHVRQR